MSIINYKKGQISDDEYFSSSGMTVQGMLGRKYDNLVDKLIRNNVSELYRIDVDNFEDSYLNILKGILEYNVQHDKRTSLSKDILAAKNKVIKAETDLSLINIQETNNVKSYIINEDVTTDELDLSMENKKKAIIEVERTRDTVNNMVASKAELDDIIEGIRIDLINSYKLINSIYNDINITNIKDFDEESEEEFTNSLPYALYSEKEYFYNQLKDCIYYEILFINDLYCDIGTISFNDLSKEQLEKVKQAYIRYNKIKKALDIKYDVLRTSFIEASQKKLETKREKKAYFNNTHSYKKILSLLNNYITLVETNEVNSLTEEEVESIEQTLGSLFNSKSVDEAARTVSELYVKEYLRNAEEYNYISGAILR